MRVALAQAVVHPGERSRNLAALTAAVTRAAGLNPAPDLILLPDGAERVLAGGAPRFLSPAMCQGFVETLAWTARDWGVWIAAGHALPRADGFIAAVTLFDPDGDPYLRYPRYLPTASIEPTAGVSPWARRATPLGRIALGTAAMLSAADAPVDQEGGADVMIVAVAGDETVSSLAPLQALARRAGSHVCLVNHCGPAVRAGLGESAILDRDGSVRARSVPGTSATLTVEFDVEPVPAAVLSEWEEVFDRD